MDHGHHLDVGVRDDVEGVPLRTDVVRVDGRRPAVHEISELSIRQARWRAWWPGAPRGSARPRSARRPARPRSRDRRRPGADEARPETEASGGSTIGVSQRTGCAFTSRIAESRSCSGRVLGKDAERTSAGEHRRDARSGHGVHVRGDDRKGGRGAVQWCQIDLKTAGDPGSPRHQEDVRVGQVDGRLRSRELHVSTVPRSQPRGRVASDDSPSETR